MSETGFPLGTIGHEPVAWLDPRGAVRPAGVGWTLRWWVGDRDQWHFDREAAVRQELIGTAPVVETRMRVHRGDARVTSWASVAAGSGLVVVDSELTNRTAEPVAVAVVVGPHRSLSHDGPRVVLDGAELVFARTPRAVLNASTLDDLALLVAAEDWPVAPSSGSAAAAGDPGGRFTAFVLPVPHTQSARWAVQTTPHGMPVAAAQGAAATPGGGLRLEALPPVQRVLSGWESQMAVGARIEPGDPAEQERVAVGRFLVALGAPGGHWTSERLASWLAAMSRVDLRGEFDTATSLLIAAQRPRGHWEGPDPVAVALDAVDAFVGMWRLGVPVDHLAHLLDPVAAASGWVVAHGGDATSATPSRFVSVLGQAAALLDAAGESRAAQRLVAAAADRRVRAEPPDSLHSQGVAASSLLGAPVDAEGRVDLVATARGLCELIDGIVRPAPCRPGDVGSLALEVAAGWRPSWIGRNVAVFDVPTIWGRVGVALRWHGERPALLWELEPWGDGRSVAEPSVVAPTIDPHWQGSGQRGEDLLVVRDAALAQRAAR